MRLPGTFFNFSQLFSTFATFATFRDFRNFRNMEPMEPEPMEPGEPEKRKVSFHPSTKRNDGLRHTTDMFNEYMRDAFGTAKREPGQRTVEILAKNGNLLGIATLQKMLNDLIWRCDCSPRGKAVILNKGGGKCGSIKRQHIPFLVSHVEYLETVIGKVRTAILRKEAQAAQALAAQTSQQRQQQDAN